MILRTITHRACLALGLSALALLGACASQAPKRARPDSHLLAFIDGPQVTRQEVVEHLGQPRASFENDKVIAYRLGQSGGGYYVVSAPQKQTELDWEGVDYDLMLRFDERGVLQEHSLIAIRSASQPH